MKFDINLKVLKYEPKKDFNSSSLCVEFTGKDVNHKVVNTIGRVASNGVPSYAFHPQLIQIEENTCAAFDNQYLQLRLSNLPIYDLPLDLSYLNEKFWKSYPYNDSHRDRHPKEQEVKAYINYHNNSNEIKFVTTNDLKLYVDGTLSQSGLQKTTQAPGANADGTSYARKRIGYSLNNNEYLIGDILSCELENSSQGMEYSLVYLQTIINAIEERLKGYSDDVEDFEKELLYGLKEFMKDKSDDTMIFIQGW